MGFQSEATSILTQGATDYSQPLISPDELDTLITDIAWSALLDPKNIPLQVELAFKIELNSPANFFVDAKKNCPALYAALKYVQNIVTISTLEKAHSTHTILFTTTVTQAEEWKLPFREHTQHSWEVDQFSLSGHFLSSIKQLGAQQRALIGGFDVIKGNLPGYEVYVPSSSQGYSIQEELTPEPQLYNCFKDLKNIFGLPVVETVTVKIQNKGHFNGHGVGTKQTEKIQFGETRCSTTQIIRQEPTRIFARGLNIMLCDSGVCAEFLKNPLQTTFNESIYIRLTTASGAAVLLLNAKPNPIQAQHLLKSIKIEKISADHHYSLFHLDEPPIHTDAQEAHCGCTIA